MTPGPWELRAPTAVYGRLQNDQNGTGDLVARTVEADDAHLIAAAPDLHDAAADALAGWHYIRQVHGDLPGVGWDRVDQALTAALAKASGK